MVRKIGLSCKGSARD